MVEMLLEFVVVDIIGKRYERDMLIFLVTLSAKISTENGGHLLYMRVLN